MLRLVACVAALTLVASPASAQKTDVIVMTNGDRVTCEIKGLDRGILEASTDSLGTLAIEWVDVRTITSAAHFEVRLSNGDRLSGPLEAGSADGRLLVGGRDLAIAAVVFFRPVEQSFWSQLDGAIDIGYSAASAGDATEWSLSTDVVRRREGLDARLSVDSFFSSREGADDANRHSVAVQIVRALANRWGLVLLAQGQRNDELQLSLRLQAGAGAIRHFVQSNEVVVSAFGGVVFNDERFTDDSPSSQTWEVAIGSQVEWFVFNSPKTRLTSYFSVFPSLSTAGRVRLELDTSIRRELIKDLFINFSIIDSFDSDPPSASATRHDFSLVTSLGWSF